MRRPVNGYNTSQIVVHWLSAGLVLFMLLPVSRYGILFPASDGVLGVPMTLHIGAGLALLVLTLLRLLLRRRLGVPEPEVLEPALLRGAGRLAHRAMCLLLLVLPVSGLGLWWLGPDPWLTVHEVARVLLTGLVGLHTSAAITHHVVMRDDALRRIIWPAE